MDGKYLLFVLVGVVQAFALSAQATEPPFCDPAKFKQLEETQPSSGVRNMHMFRIGGVSLAGMAVGNSDVASVQQVAASRGRTVTEREKSCTWYLNDGNPRAEAAFSHRYVDRPTSNIPASVDQYMSVLSSSFDQDAVNVVSCAEQHGYVALGCDGMKHRGPTFFAMVLSFAGCVPEHSVAIANGLWGANGIPVATRIAIAKAAYDLGTERSDARLRLERAFLTPVQ